LIRIPRQALFEGGTENDFDVPLRQVLGSAQLESALV
jgi:hypothetical protein